MRLEQPVRLARQIAVHLGGVVSLGTAQNRRNNPAHIELVSKTPELYPLYRKMANRKRTPEPVQSVPRYGKREQTSLRRYNRGGRRLHLAQGRSCLDNGEQAGDGLLLKRAESWNLHLANVAGAYGS